MPYAVAILDIGMSSYKSSYKKTVASHLAGRRFVESARIQSRTERLMR
jgi:hypothetical protein